MIEIDNTISQIEPEKDGYNLRVKVLEICFSMEKTNLEGKKTRTSEVLIGDETAVCYLLIKNGEKSNQKNHHPFFFSYLLNHFKKKNRLISVNQATRWKSEMQNQ